MTIIYGYFDPINSELFIGYDGDGWKVRIDKKLIPDTLMPYKDLWDDDENNVLMPFHCTTSIPADKKFRTASKCFANYHDAFEHANMIIEGLEYELHELTEIVQQNKSLN